MNLTTPLFAASEAKNCGVNKSTGPWMGGLIAWPMIRDHDRERARAMLVGIVATVAWIVLYSVLVPVPRT